MTLHWTHQAQLQYAWGGRYGAFNCNACSSGMTAEIHSGGAYLLTGARIRAASNEPIPDPDSPGLNHTQAAAAVFRLTSGKVDLDVRNDYAFDSAKIRGLGGAPFSISGRRQVLIDRGQGHGNTFGGGHDISVFVIDGIPWLDDPLTGRYKTDWETLRRFGGTLVINEAGDIAGYGSAWVMFGRDVTVDWWPDYIERPPAGATFAVQFDPGTYPKYTAGGTRAGTFTTAKGFTAYGTGRKRAYGRLIGKLLTDRPGIYVDVHSGNAYWSK